MKIWALIVVKNNCRSVKLLIVFCEIFTSATFESTHNITYYDLFNYSKGETTKEHRKN